jgi:hypothetical protein
MYKEAEKLSKQALKLDPNDVSSQANLRAAQYSMKIRYAEVSYMYARSMHENSLTQ